MGEARRRRTQAGSMVYHHTSTLHTNLLWMSGEIRTEGTMEPVLHPMLGELQTDARFRRAMKDFPAVAWFTTRVEVPRCLLRTNLIFVDKKTGEQNTIELNELEANTIALNRIALGFRIADISVTPWSQHRGFETSEGRDLNDTARDAGDDPMDWYVSECPIDLMSMCELRGSSSIAAPKLERIDGYLASVKKMVSTCRNTPGIYIPPTWLKRSQAERVARSVGVPIVDL